MSAQRATGDETRSFNNYQPRTYNWGASLTRAKFNLRANWNYRGRNRQDPVTGRNIEAGTYTWGAKQLFLDLQGEVVLRPRLALFATAKQHAVGHDGGQAAIGLEHLQLDRLIGGAGHDTLDGAATRLPAGAGAHRLADELRARGPPQGDRR